MVASLLLISLMVPLGFDSSWMKEKERNERINCNSVVEYGGNMSSAKATLESDTHVSEQALNGDFAVK
ncbi:hypothetical protein Syun_019709 [Stephania yunnanensis]|uniref:Uncharacterized protein n=1 Tax=Stephania yunnanensis TaxID=152371 RepID=A0AAP0NW44_9MAGN